MKKIKKYLSIIVVTLVTSMCLTSCAIEAYAQSDDMYVTSTVDYNVIVRLGTPFYVDNVLSYYFYNGWYYYPYVWENHSYFYPYRHMQPRGFIFRPGPGFRPMNHPMFREIGRHGFRQSSTRQPMNRSFVGQPQIQNRQYRGGMSTPSRSFQMPQRGISIGGNRGGFNGGNRGNFGGGAHGGRR